MRPAGRVLLLLFLVGCRQPAPHRTAAIGTDIFEDVPAPKSAVYLHAHEESFGYSARTFRCGRFHYEYQGDAGDAARFFRETMPSAGYGWTLVSEDGTGEGSFNLVFEKSGDRCTVDIDRIPKPDVGKTRNVDILVRVNYRK